jgi:hypothetical protein
MNMPWLIYRSLLRVYSSNYIAIGSPQRRGVANQGFLFHFWPVIWGTDNTHGSNAAYFYNTTEAGVSHCAIGQSEYLSLTHMKNSMARRTMPRAPAAR